MIEKRQPQPDGSGEPAPPYTIATIARLTSFSSQRLRTWERRYGLLRPTRGPGGHRLYGIEDLRVLRAVRRHLDSGRTIGEIRDMGRAALLGEPDGFVVPTSARELQPTPHAVGPQADRWSSRIVDAALSFDEPALHRLLDEVFAAMPTEEAIHGVLAGTQSRIGELWKQGLCNIASEHVATRVFLHRVRTLVDAASRASLGPAPRILGACLPAERHELGLLAVGYSLALRGSRVTILGAEVPFEDLRGACESVDPDAVLLSVSSDNVFRAARDDLLAFRERIDPRIALVIGGSGAPAADAELESASIHVFAPGSSPAATAQSLLDSIGASRRTA